MRGNDSGPQLAVFLHLKDKGQSFDDHDVLILDQEDRWFERGVREAIHVHIRKSLTQQGWRPSIGSVSYLSCCPLMVPRKTRTTYIRKTTDNNP